MARKKVVEEVEEDEEEYEEDEDEDTDEDYEEEDADEEDDDLDADYDAEPDDLTDDQIKRLHGHGNVRANICFDCRGRLLSPTGSHAEYHFDDGNKSFAAAICLYCKMLRVFTDWGHVIPLQDLQEVIARLRAHNNGINYAVACWSLVVMDKDAGIITERKYCVNMDGSINTRKDICDLYRTLKSFETDGWEEYKPKIKIKNVEHALHVVGESLEPRGYRRQF